MQGARFTVLLCVHRLPALLAFAIRTVLWQSHANFELFVVCDGAPEAAALARAYAADDPRIRVFDFEKGERNGERHRHAVLALCALGRTETRYRPGRRVRRKPGVRPARRPSM